MLLFLCLTIAAAALNAPAGTKIESLPDYNGPVRNAFFYFYFSSPLVPLLSFSPSPSQRDVVGFVHV